MKFSAYSTLLILFHLIALDIHSQDVIVKRDSLRITCKVVEVGEIEVSYYRFDNSNGPLYKIGKNKIAYLIYENGVKDYLGLASPTNPNNEEKGLLTNSVRFNLYGPFMGYASLEYERQLKKQMAVTLEGGVIGVNSFSNDYKFNGGLLGVGLRVYDARYQRPNRLYKNNLKFGAYALGKIHFESYSARAIDNSINDTDYNFSNTSAGLSVGGGVTLHFLKFIQLDLNTSFGYFILDLHKPNESLSLGQERDRFYSFSLAPLQLESRFAGEFNLSIGFNF